MRLLFCLIIPILIISFSLGSCSRHSDAWAKLNAAEAILDDQPETALSLLQSIDTSKLSGEDEKARYALLTLCSLDDNRIRLTDTVMAASAVEYYSRKGTPEQIMKSLLFQGRTFRYLGKDEDAMTSYIKALEPKNQVADSLLVASLLVGQGHIYNELYNHKKALNNYLEAASIYDKKDKRISELRTLYKALSSSMRINYKQKADSIFGLIKAKRPNCNYDFKNYDSFNLNYYVTFGYDSLINDEIELLVSNGDMNDDTLVEIAGAYSHLGEHQKALEYFQQIDTAAVKNSLRLLAYASDIYANVGRYKEAYDYNIAFYVKIDSADLKLYNSDILFLENKHNLELSALKEKNMRENVVAWSTAALLLLCSVIIYIRYRFVAFRKRKQLELENQKLINENLELQIAQLNEESERLKEILDNKKSLPEQVIKVLQERTKLLNSILAHEIKPAGSSKNNPRQLIEELLRDKDRFMDTNRLAFTASNPEFIAYFEHYGLTTNEINHVCLYALGLNGKEIGIYTNRKRHYIISSEIRHKLSLDEHATNLGPYIRNILDTTPAICN